MWGKYVIVDDGMRIDTTQMTPNFHGRRNLAVANSALDVVLW